MKLTFFFLLFSSWSLAYIFNFDVVKEINPTSHAFPYGPQYVQSGNLLFLAADDGTAGTELWITNGLVKFINFLNEARAYSGTQMLVDILPGAASSFPQNFRVGANSNIVFFSAIGPNVGRELYRSDGTQLGKFSFIGDYLFL